MKQRLCMARCGEYATKYHHYVSWLGDTPEFYCADCAREREQKITATNKWLIDDIDRYPGDEIAVTFGVALPFLRWEQVDIKLPFGIWAHGNTSLMLKTAMDKIYEQYDDIVQVWIHYVPDLDELLDDMEDDNVSDDV